MLAHPPGDAAIAAFDKMRAYVAEAGRDPKSIDIEIWTSVAEGGPDDWREEAKFWKAAGVTHITVNNSRERGHHKRMAGRTLSDHISGIERYRDAVADVL
jgi:hypothetical protein